MVVVTVVAVVVVVVVVSVTSARRTEAAECSDVRMGSNWLHPLSMSFVSTGVVDEF